MKQSTSTKKENEMDNLLKDYNDVHEGLGHLHRKLHLEVDKTIEPVQHTLRKVLIATKEEPRQKLLSMEKANILKILDTLSIKINLCHMNRPYLNGFQCQASHKQQPKPRSICQILSSSPWVTSHWLAGMHT